MTVEEAVEIISKNKEYRVNKLTSRDYIIMTNYMYNPFDCVSLYIRDKDETAYLTDCGATLRHSKFSENEIIDFGRKNNFGFWEGYLYREFKSLKDVNDLISLIDKLC